MFGGLSESGKRHVQREAEDARVQRWLHAHQKVSQLSVGRRSRGKSQSKAEVLSDEVFGPRTRELQTQVRPQEHEPGLKIPVQEPEYQEKGQRRAFGITRENPEEAEEFEHEQTD